MLTDIQTARFPLELLTISLCREKVDDNMNRTVKFIVWADKDTRQCVVYLK